MSKTTEQLRENPYLIFCPECGVTHCYVCAKYSDMLDDMDGYDQSDMPYIRRKCRERRKHLATYDHSALEFKDKLLFRVSL